MKVAVVTRKLPMGDKSQTVVSAVIVDPDEDMSSDQLLHFFKLKSEQHIQIFKAEFPEFKYAEWDLKVLDSL